MRSILCTIPFYKSHFPHTQLFCTHPVVKVIRQNVCLCQNLQQLYPIFTGHGLRSYSTGVHLCTTQLSKLYPAPHLPTSTPQRSHL